MSVLEYQRMGLLPEAENTYEIGSKRVDGRHLVKWLLGMTSEAFQHILPVCGCTYEDYTDCLDR